MGKQEMIDGIMADYTLARAKVVMGQCPFCNLDVTDDGFRDETSRREFNISGLCQCCQDEFFDEGKTIEYYIDDIKVHVRNGIVVAVPHKKNVGHEWIGKTITEVRKGRTLKY